MKDEILKLISLGDTENALKKLSVIQPGETVLLQAQYANGLKQFNLTLIDYSEWQKIVAKVNYAMVELANKTSGSNNPVKTTPEITGKKVFISYSREDKSNVLKIKEYLQNAGFQIIIDEETGAAGQAILEFIQESIRKCDVVLSVVSKNSLLSPWVSQESMAALYAIWMADKIFVPIRLDDFQFDIKFQIAIQKGIQEKLTTLDADLAELKSYPGADTRAFDEERSELISMQTNLGKIMQKLKNVLTLKATGNEFDSTMQKVVAKIKEPVSE